MTDTAAPALAEPADVRRLIDGAGLLGLDLETTGLNPRRDRVRLLSLHDGRRGLVMDCFAHDVRQLLPALKGRILLCHHAAFDLGWLWHLGLRDLPETVCTFILAQLLTAGEDYDRGFSRCGLAACCKRWLSKDLNKELQQSDFSGQLSAEQIAYAKLDAEVLPPLFTAMAEEIRKADLTAVSEVELRCLPAWIWLSQSGAPFDQQAWLGLAHQAAQNKDRLAQQLDSLAPDRAGRDLFGQPFEAWNWDSPQQVQEVLGQQGFDVATTADAQLALLPGDFAARMRDYRGESQLLKTHGTNWLEKTEIVDSRVFADWRQIGTVTGRTACREPNLQNVPRKEEYRRCFRAPPGKRLVKADFSQLQMRLACRWARDDALYQIFAAGLDQHTQTAKNLTGKAEPSKLERQVAKSCIAEGQLVLTNRGLVPIQDVSCCDHVWDGMEWVEHDGVVFQGYREVIEHDGLQATPCHEVFLETGERTLFEQAASSRRRLAATAIDRCSEGATRTRSRNSSLVRVYDLLNAGPRHRFTVSGKLVSNCNFLMTFAGSAEALRIYCSTNFGLMLSKEEAEKHRTSFLEAYPGLARWHRDAFRSKTKELRSVMGRRRLLHDHTPPTERVNTPCQADESDGAKLALGRLWRERGKHPSVQLVIFNHDECVLECDAEAAEDVAGWLKAVMTEEMEPILHPVPCKVDATIAPSWGG